MSINLALSHERSSDSVLKIQRKARQLLLEYVVACFQQISTAALSSQRVITTMFYVCMNIVANIPSVL